MTASSSKSSSSQKATSALSDLRDQIDDIDNALLTLLAKRQGLSRQIATKKALGSNVFRPDREMSLLRNLIAAHHTIDPRLIMGLWRHIISASISEQKPDYTITHSQAARGLAESHGAGYMQCQSCDDVPSAIASLQNGTADCVILTDDELHSHSQHLVPDEIVVAASIGFLVQEGHQRGYILCRELPLPSGDDKIVLRHDDGSLSFVDMADDMTTQLAQTDGVIVGRYATPLVSKENGMS